MSKVNQKTVKMVELALLAAIIIVLQQIVIPLPGGLTLSLVLIPIVVGAVLHGPAAGAALGAVFGAVVTVLVITGRAGLLSTMMWQTNPVMTVVVCMLKGTAAGWVAGLLYKAAGKKPLAATFLAAGAAPVVNTGLFLAGIFTCFADVTVEFAAGIGIEGKSVLYIAIVVLVGVNFLVELAANLLFATGIANIVKAVKKAK